MAKVRTFKLKITRESNRTWRLLPLCALLVLAGCGPETDDSVRVASGSPTSTFVLNDSQLEVVTREADRGDVAAMLRLVRHYEHAGSMRDTERWLRAAAAKGDVSAMQNLAVLITVQPSAAKCREAESLLVDAISRAKESTQRENVAQTLKVFRQGFRGKGPCVQWLDERSK